MLYLPNQNSIFIHVPKTGGTSLTSALKEYARMPILPLRALGNMADNRGLNRVDNFKWSYKIFGLPRHSPAYVVRSELGPELYDSAFTFAFVRNPYNLVASEFHYIKRKPRHYLHKVVSSMNNIEEYLDLKLSFPQGHRVNATPSDFLCNKRGELLVKRVGKIENYTEDSNDILKTMGIDKTIGKENSTSYKSIELLFNEESCSKVSKLYARDFEIFGYSKPW